MTDQHSSSKKARRNFTPEQKIAILREHFIDKIAISELCEKHNMQPTLFYRWQKTMFENGPQLFIHKNSGKKKNTLEQKVTALQNKLAHKDEVIAEIMSEHITLKKELGEL